MTTFAVPLLLTYIAYISTKKNQLEQQLNDKKRETYHDFINALETALSNTNPAKKEQVGKQLKSQIQLFKKKLILFAGPSSILLFKKWLLETNENDNVKNFVNIENLIKSLRKEIGLSNRGLKKFDILQVYIKDNLKEAIKDGKTNKVSTENPV